MDRRKLGKNRGGAAPRDAQDTERRSQQAIEKRVQQDVDTYLKENREWLEELPQGTRADIIKAHLPRPKPIDQDLEAQYLSMKAALEVVPDMDDLTAELAALRIEVDKYKGMYEVTVKVSKCMERKDYEWVMPLIKDAFRRGREYSASKAELDIPEEEWRRILEYFMRKSKTARHEKKAGKNAHQPGNPPDQRAVGAFSDEVEEISSVVCDGGVPGSEVRPTDSESG